MLKKVLEFIRENHMLPEGGTVAAGISGGADSVCLLFILLKIREILPFRLICVHVNHRIRAEAGEDADFVERLCRKWDCPYRCVEEDVEGYALRRRISTEEAGRILRYRAFRQILEEEGGGEGRIAVAHHQNDSAETLLFNLFRGSGLRGLAGIHPVMGDVIRPLLCVSRPEIETFLEENGISFCIDRTNYEDTYTRNKIRHHILAYAQEEICSQAVSHIYDTSVMMREAERFLEKCTGQAMERCAVVSEKEISIAIAAYDREDPFIRKRLLLQAVERLSGKRKDISAVHVRLLAELFTRQGNGRLDLPGGLRAYREYDRVRLVRPGPESTCGPTPLLIPGETSWGEEIRVSCEVFPFEKSQNIPQKTYTKWIDYDKIVKSLVLRTRQTGDYLMTCGSGGRKSLKAYLIGEKIPAARRDEILLVADGSHIVWTVGHRISGHYKVDDGTRTVLQIKITGGGTDGREDQGIVNGRGSG